ncbi:MAG: hypothetical protein ACHQIM_18975 [Sphingobacteriales bacterium]
MIKETSIKLFESKQIRTAFNEVDQKWYFSIQDVVQLLSDSSDVKQYLKRMLSRDRELNANWGTICTLVEMGSRRWKKKKNTGGQYRKFTAYYSIHPIP